MKKALSLLLILCLLSGLLLSSAAASRDAFSFTFEEFSSSMGFVLDIVQEEVPLSLSWNKLDANTYKAATESPLFMIAETNSQGNVTKISVGYKADTINQLEIFEVGQYVSPLLQVASISMGLLEDNDAVFEDNAFSSALYKLWLQMMESQEKTTNSLLTQVYRESVSFAGYTLEFAVTISIKEVYVSAEMSLLP